MTGTETLSSEEVKYIETSLKSLNTGKIIFWPPLVDDFALFLYEPEETIQQEVLNSPDLEIEIVKDAFDEKPHRMAVEYLRKPMADRPEIKFEDSSEPQAYYSTDPFPPLPKDHPALNAFLRAKWLIGMSDDFVKSTEGLDKKMKGSLLEAIGHICTKPITPRGDTVKPLNANMKGLWRYRIGDFRLLYKPDIKNKTVFLILFAKRSDVYQ